MWGGYFLKLVTNTFCEIRLQGHSQTNESEQVGRSGWKAREVTIDFGEDSKQESRWEEADGRTVDSLISQKVFI